jgi:hypothetical protein
MSNGQQTVNWLGFGPSDDSAGTGTVPAKEPEVPFESHPGIYPTPDLPKEPERPYNKQDLLAYLAFALVIFIIVVYVVLRHINHYRSQKAALPAPLFIALISGVELLVAFIAYKAFHGGKHPIIFAPFVFFSFFLLTWIFIFLRTTNDRSLSMWLALLLIVCSLWFAVTVYQIYSTPLVLLPILFAIYAFWWTFINRFPEPIPDLTQDL